MKHLDREEKTAYEEVLDFLSVGEGTHIPTKDSEAAFNKIGLNKVNRIAWN